MPVTFAHPLAVLVLWWHLLRPAYRDSLPEPLRNRTWDAPTGRRIWLLALPALVVGSATHVLWDQFTHPHTWVAFHLDVLQSTLAGLPLTVLLH